MRSARSLALVATLAGLPVLAAFTTDGRFRLSRDLRAGERGWVSGLLDVAPEFYFSGMNPGTVQDLCDAVQAGDKSGEWWCLRSDGGTLSGSQIAFTSINTPGQAAQRVCSNDTDCLNVNMRGPLNGSTSAGSMDYTAATTAPTGDFSVVFTSTPKPVVPAGSYMFQVHKRASGDGQYVFSNDRAGSTISETLGVGTIAQGPTTSIAPGVEVMRTITATSSGSELGYYDGVQTYTGAHAPFTLGQNVRHGVGGRPDELGVYGFATLDYHRGAFFTEKILSPSDVARLSDAQFVEADDLATDSGVALTWVRASVRACITADATRGSHLAAGRPCVSGNGVNVAPAVTNLLLRSDALALASAVVAPWVAVGTPVLTGNAVADLTGYQLLATIEDDAAGASEGVTQSVATTAAVKYTASCWLASGTLTVARLKIVGTDDATGDTTCTLTGLTTGAVRRSCTTTAAYGAPVTAVSLQILAGTNDAATGTVSAGACQLITGDTAGPYVRTDGTQASSVADVLSGSYSFTSGVASSSGVWKAPEGFATARYLVNARKDASNGFQAFTDSTGALICRWRVGGTNYDIASTATFTASTASTWKCSTFVGGSSACVNGTCATASDGGTITPATGAHTVYVATSNTTGNEADGILSGLCLDGLSTRCQ